MAEGREKEEGKGETDRQTDRESRKFSSTANRSLGAEVWVWIPRQPISGFRAYICW